MGIKKKGDDCTFINSPDYKNASKCKKIHLNNKCQGLMESGVLSLLAKEFFHKLRHFIPEIE